MEYEILEKESLTRPEAGSKTNPGTVEHNKGELREGEVLSFHSQEGQRIAFDPADDMANETLTQPESEAGEPLSSGIEIDVSFGAAIEEKPLWADLYESLQDLFFPPQLPPLELTSTPIPVPDRMAVKANPWAIGIAAFVNGAILAAVLFLGVKTYINSTKPKPPLTATILDVPEFKAPKAAVAAGGGGGSHDNMEAIKGRIPPRMTTPAVTPKVDMPPLPTIEVQKDIVIPDNPNLTNFGMSKSANVKLASGGNGSGMGLGNGHGNGYGNGDGGNIGGGLYRVGGAISGPVVLFAPDAEFSDEARRAKYQGVVVVSIIVNAQGNPQNPRVVRALGMGLDEKAIEAVMKYKFKPSMKDGKTPVPVQVNVEVNFRLL